MLKRLWNWLTLTSTGRAVGIVASIATILSIIGGGIDYLRSEEEASKTTINANNAIQTNIGTNNGTIVGQQFNSPTTINTSPPSTPPYYPTSPSPLSASPSPIRAHIAGFLGQGDCSEVRYEFSVRDKALVKKAVVVPDGIESSEFIGTIVNEDDDVMEIRGEKPAAAKGWSATVTYIHNGVTERLQWRDHAPDREPVTWDRCA